MEKHYRGLCSIWRCLRHSARVAQAICTVVRPGAARAPVGGLSFKIVILSFIIWYCSDYLPLVADTSGKFSSGVNNTSEERRRSEAKYLFLNYRRNEDEAKYLFPNYQRNEDEAKYLFLNPRRNKDEAKYSFLNCRRNKDKAKYLFPNPRRNEEEVKYSFLNYWRKKTKPSIRSSTIDDLPLLLPT